MVHFFFILLEGSTTEAEIRAVAIFVTNQTIDIEHILTKNIENLYFSLH